MDLGQWVKDNAPLITISISLFTFAWTLIWTFYWNMWRGAEYERFPIREVEFSYNAKMGFPEITLPIHITNIGGKTGVIHSFSIELCRRLKSSMLGNSRLISTSFLPKSEYERIEFYSFIEMIDKRFERVKPFVIKKDESCLKEYIFKPRKISKNIPSWVDYEYQKDIYYLRLFCRLRNKKTLIAEQAIKFEQLPNKQGAIAFASEEMPKKLLVVGGFRRRGVDLHNLHALFTGYSNDES